MEIQKPPSEELLDLLVEEGAVASADADSVRTRQRETWIPLGKILRQKGWLSMGQLVEVLQLQAKNPGLRLGEIALQCGFCTAHQVEDALRTQRDLSPHVLDLLVESRSVDPEKVLRAVTRYVRALESRVSCSPGN